jgi:hypothetical protein
VIYAPKRPASVLDSTAYVSTMDWKDYAASRPKKHVQGKERLPDQKPYSDEHESAFKMEDASFKHESRCGSQSD